MSSPKHDVRDLAARFARKARSDEIALEKLADDPDVPDDLIGVHAQQALEKLLKAALVYAGVTPPRIYDLGERCARSRPVGSQEVPGSSPGSPIRSRLRRPVDLVADDVLRVVISGAGLFVA